MTAGDLHHPLLRDPELYDALVRYARRFTGGDEDRARDVTHDAYLRVLGQQPATFHAGYLYAAVHNRGVDLLRREKYRATDTTPEPGAPTRGQARAVMMGPVESPEAATIAREELGAVLTTRDGALVVLAAKGYTDSEVAGALGITMQAYKHRLFRARRRLRAGS